jgi:hypothetical protein
MKALIRVHKILIASAIGLGLLLAVWGLARGHRALAAASVAAAAALGFYLRGVFRRYRLPGGGGADSGGAAGGTNSG